jgi:20S proteasome alpha/beta subunit
LTVCIAALCLLTDKRAATPVTHQVVVTASDRMITAGDIEYEPAQPKAYTVTNRVVVLFSGDVLAQAEIGRRANLEILSKGGGSVSDIAAAWHDSYDQYRSEEAENQVLAPYGLDLAAFLRRQQEFSTTFVEDTAYRLRQFRIGSSVLLAGVDDYGAHIYTVSDLGGQPQLRCHDPIGFAAIGLGANHAESHFMFRAYKRDTELSEALLTTLSAKRRAEAAPGVGKQTDMAFVSFSTGVINMTDGPLYNTIKDEHRQMVTDQDTRSQQAIQTVDREIRPLFEPPPPPPPPPTAPAPTA